MIKHVKISEQDKKESKKLILPKKEKTDLDYTRGIVQKPWGQEYLFFSDGKISIWMLYILNEQSTSLHCHAKKTTFLLVLDGSVIVSTLKNKIKLSNNQAVKLDKKVFHSTRATSTQGSWLIEIENSIEKEDVIRLKDVYGREKMPYTESKYIKKGRAQRLDNKEGSKMKFKDYLFSINTHEHIKDIKNVNNYCIVLSGSQKGELTTIKSLKNKRFPVKIISIQEVK